MIVDWQHFDDPLNSVHRPAQMGPLWQQAMNVTGMPIRADIWVEDPPESSIPACIAVKVATAQSAIAGDLLLRQLREAIMLEGRNIAHRDVLLAAAGKLGEVRPEAFDFERFRHDLDAPEAKLLLEEDVREARFLGIGRFPCLSSTVRRRERFISWVGGHFNRYVKRC